MIFSNYMHMKYNDLIKFLRILCRNNNYLAKFKILINGRRYSLLSDNGKTLNLDVISP